MGGSFHRFFAPACTKQINLIPVRTEVKEFAVTPGKTDEIELGQFYRPTPSNWLPRAGSASTAIPRRRWSYLSNNTKKVVSHHAVTAHCRFVPLRGSEGWK